MFVPFQTLPAHSRIWIYQSDRELTSQEIGVITRQLETFCDSWNAHQQPLKTGFTIAHNRFLVLAADEDYHLPSGCSIDSSVRVLKSMGQELNVNFFDRTNIAFLVDGTIKTFALPALKAHFEKGDLTADTPTFNNLVPSRGDFESDWLVRSENTWLAKYLPKSTLH
jgi:hypothetical protein